MSTEHAGHEHLTVAAFARGDPEAARRLVREHRPAVRRFARRWLGGDAASADDVVQEVFLAALRHGETFRGASTARVWLLSITRRECLRSQRRRAGEPSRFESLEDLGLAAGWGQPPPPTPEALASEAEQRARLIAALNELEREDREILLLREIEQISGAETAQVLELSLPAMKSRLHRARLRLAAAVRKGMG